MNRILLKGKLKRWNDDKGFGFIGLENGGRDVFVHISALRSSGRRPVVGDLIVFQIHTDSEGKKRAFNARIDGVAEVGKKSRRTTFNVRKNSKYSSNVLILAALIAIGLFVHLNFFSNKLDTKTTPSPKASGPIREKPSPSCDGRVYCSEMTSCEEASFFLRNCPGTKMDGDRDGVPCESQWCTRQL